MSIRSIVFGKLFGPKANSKIAAFPDAAKLRILDFSADYEASRGPLATLQDHVPSIETTNIDVKSSPEYLAELARCDSLSAKIATLTAIKISESRDPSEKASSGSLDPQRRRELLLLTVSGREALRMLETGLIPN